MSSLMSVEALPGIGLAGDRYAEAKNRRAPDYEVTLIEWRTSKASPARQAASYTRNARRNIVTEECAE